MPPRIEPIEHTADIGLRVWADTPADAFAAIAGAMFDAMVNREHIPPRERWSIRVIADGWEDLLVAWLEELLYLYETERAIPEACHITDIAPDHLEAELLGDYLDPTRDEQRVQIKAVTYHQLRAEETEEGFFVQVIFDI
jgi:SHS2 domain-containing protein